MNKSVSVFLICLLLFTQAVSSYHLYPQSDQLRRNKYFTKLSSVSRYYDYQYQSGNVERNDVVEEHLLPVLAIGFFAGLWGSFLGFENILNIISAKSSVSVPSLNPRSHLLQHLDEASILTHWDYYNIFTSSNIFKLM